MTKAGEPSSELIMRSTVRVLGVFGLGVLACGGQSLSNAGPKANGGATVPDVSSALPKGGDDASTGGVAGDTSDDTGGARPCVVQDGGGFGTGLTPTCADLEVLTVSDPVILDKSGGGKLSPGEDASLRVSLNEVAGRGFSWYPGVSFVSDDASVSIKSSDWYYAIAACTRYQPTAVIHVSSDAKPGSIVHFTAQAAMMNSDCPSAPALVVSATIE